VDDRQKISVVLSTAELDRFNSYCDDKGHKKSTLIRRLIREYLDRENYPAPDDARLPGETARPAGRRPRARSRRKGS
jgi:metal-responsive CopG/Arc/MetJ family transcriptional regulator